jgi:Zn-dependent peptidase ImmA (M78 family)
MNTVKTINTLLIAALALGSLASTATVAYQVSTATANQAETAVSAFVRDSEVAQVRGPQNDEAGRAFYLAHELGHVLDAQGRHAPGLVRSHKRFHCNIDAYPMNGASIIWADLSTARSA